MLDSPLQKLIPQHWRSALLASASVMLSACVANDQSSSSAAQVSSEVAVSSSSAVTVPSSSVAPSSSSVESSSSQVVVVSSSSSVISSSPVVVSSSSAAPVGMSLLSSPGTFSNGGEDFNVIPSASFGGEVSFSIPSADTAEPWAVQMTHVLSVTAGEQYVICFDAKTTASAGMRSLTVGFDNNATGGYANISGGPIDEVLTAQYQNFSPIVTADATAADARLYFNLAAEAGDIQLDNIGVYAGDSCGGSGNSNSSSSSAPVASSSQATTSSASNPNTGDFIINDDFESGSNGQVPAGWRTSLGHGLNAIDVAPTSSNAAVIDNTRAHSGTNSVVVKTSDQGAPHFLFKELPSGLSSLYVRAYVYSLVQIGGGEPGSFSDHAHFTSVTETPGDDNAKEIRFGPVFKSYLGGFMPKNKDAPSSHTIPTSVPANKWTCVEWAVEKNSTYDRMYGWVDGSQVLKAESVDDWKNGPMADFELNLAMKTVNFGWRKFGSGADVSRIWFDDIKVSSSRIGCD